MIDVHNHLHQFEDADAIIAEMKRVGITQCVVNGTSEKDWQSVSDLAARHPDFILPAFGLHPWFVHDRSDSWLERLAGMLERHPRSSIGECGVDGWIGDVAMSEQVDVFLPQLALARERKLPITIHALKAWGPLMEALKSEPPPESGFLLHSFGGSAELADQLARMGACFSFSGYFLHPKKAKVLESFRAIPADRLMLETDAPSMTPPMERNPFPLPEGKNHPANLPSIAQGLAEALGRDPADLRLRCDANARRFFKMEARNSD